MMHDMFPKKHVEYEQPAAVIPPKKSGGLSYAENVRYSSDESSSDSESESDSDILSWLFPFPSAWPQSAYAISLTPTVALTLALMPNTDAQHCYQRSPALHIKARPLTRPRRLYITFTLPLCFSSYRSTTTYAYPLWLYLAQTSDHHSHQSLHIRPPFSIEYLLLYPSYPLLVSLPRTSSHFSISLLFLNYI